MVILQPTSSQKSNDRVTFRFGAFVRIGLQSACLLRISAPSRLGSWLLHQCSQLNRLGGGRGTVFTLLSSACLATQKTGLSERLCTTSQGGTAGQEVRHSSSHSKDVRSAALCQSCTRLDPLWWPRGNLTKSLRYEFRAPLSYSVVTRTARVHVVRAGFT